MGSVCFKQPVCRDLEECHLIRDEDTTLSNITHTPSKHLYISDSGTVRHSIVQNSHVFSCGREEGYHVICMKSLTPQQKSLP